MGSPSRSRRSSSSNVSPREGESKSRLSSPRQPTGRRGSLKKTPSKASARSKSAESSGGSPRSPQKAKSKEGRPTSAMAKSRSAEKEQKASSSGSGTKEQNGERKTKDSTKQVATRSAPKEKTDGTPRDRRRQSKFPRTSAGKITKARRRSSVSPSGAKIEEILVSPSSRSRKKAPPKKKSPNLRKRLSVITEESRESISSRRRSATASSNSTPSEGISTRSRSASTSTSSATEEIDCLEAQDVSLRGSLRENGFVLKQLLKKSDAIAPERGGNVYLAHSVKLLPSRDVALKILRRDFAPRTRRQFFLPQEYYICRDLSKKAAHPNIVEFHPPLLLFGSRVCFPMEHYAGGDLLELLYREKKIPEAELRGYFSQALDAVQYLHSKDIAHLNLKCEHFLLDGAANVRLCGFGCATRFDPEKLEEDIYCQTVGYTPPEVVNRFPYDPMKADVFALGATLYILCMGRFPNPKLLHLMGKGAPNFPRHSEVSDHLKELIRAMMEADWSRRIDLQEVKRMAWMKRK
ncbi:CBL-interacting protein kinase 14-like [Branchiostoma floridae]|uniref:non-specific serine/threonine protein kinase n=2 Tax=Branchiostoma floridae TaxID=7739 RepID=A0A9J7M8D2_BRAFL|nr:CBL-interacting protein kinase 14-like [Branchiostoma floridae]